MLVLQAVDAPPTSLWVGRGTHPRLLQKFAANASGPHASLEDCLGLLGVAPRGCGSSASLLWAVQLCASHAQVPCATGSSLAFPKIASFS